MANYPISGELPYSTPQILSTTAVDYTAGTATTLYTIPTGSVGVSLVGVIVRYVAGIMPASCSTLVAGNVVINAQNISALTAGNYNSMMTVGSVVNTGTAGSNVTMTSPAAAAGQVLVDLIGYVF